jgi:hypothetical protein
VAKEVLAQQQPTLGFALELVDISGDPGLEAAYRTEIPVVYVAGRKAFKYRVEPVELARRVRAAASQAAS